MNYSTLMWMATIVATIGIFGGRSPALREHLAVAEQTAFVCTTEMGDRLDQIEAQVELYLQVYDTVLQPNLELTTD